MKRGGPRDVANVRWARYGSIKCEGFSKSPLAFGDKSSRLLAKEQYTHAATASRGNMNKRCQITSYERSRVHSI